MPLGPQAARRFISDVETHEFIFMGSWSFRNLLWAAPGVHIAALREASWDGRGFSEAAKSNQNTNNLDEHLIFL